jgi:arginine deiminase
MVNGKPRTRAALEAAGCQVHGYDGSEISLKGDGGPTCLTAPIWRGAARR